jgi:hypothetical protein
MVCPREDEDDDLPGWLCPCGESNGGDEERCYACGAAAPWAMDDEDWYEDEEWEDEWDGPEY